MHFFRYAPKRIIWLNFLTVIQAAVGSAGLLFLIPLAQLAGLDLSQYTSQHGGIVDDLVAYLNDLPFTQSLSQLLPIYVLVMTVIAILSYHHKILGAKLQQAYVRSMRSELYQAILESSWSFLSQRRSSAYLHRVGAQVQSMNMAAHQLIGLMHQILSMIIFIGLMFVVHPPFTIATLVIGLILAIILLPIRYTVRNAGKRQLRGYQEIFAVLAEHLSNLKIIKATAREAQFHDIVSDISGELEQQQVRMTRANSIIGFANSVGLAAGFAVLLYYGVEYFNVALAEFVILMMVMSRILPLLANFQQSIQGIIFSLPAYTDIEETLIRSKAEKEIGASHDIEPLVTKDKIELDSISFAYPSLGRDSSKKPDDYLFDRLNIVLHANETVALKGQSGIGKTTIADLFASLLSPLSGRLLIDGQELDETNRLAWRRAVAYVTQEVYLFNDSLRYNLTWAADQVSDDEIWRALEMASLKDIVEALPQGLESRIGDRGIRFSGGERQRLAIARALLMKPALLILDEATSALDDDNEQRIQGVIQRLHGQLTVLIIAHRESSLGIADRIIDVEQFRTKV